MFGYPDPMKWTFDSAKGLAIYLLAGVTSRSQADRTRVGLVHPSEYFDSVARVRLARVSCQIRLPGRVVKRLPNTREFLLRIPRVSVEAERRPVVRGLELKNANPRHHQWRQEEPVTTYEWLKSAAGPECDLLPEHAKQSANSSLANRRASGGLPQRSTQNS